MQIQPHTDRSATAPQRPIVVDPISIAGRAVTILVYLAGVGLVGLLLVWVVTEHAHQYFVTRAEQAAQAQDYQTAVSDYTWALRIDNTDADVYLQRGAVLQQLGERERALADFSSFIALRPGEADGYLERGLGYVELRRHADAPEAARQHAQAALADLDRGLALRPRSVPALLARGELREQAGQRVDALADLGNAIAAERDNVELVARRGAFFRTPA